jgi:hypothetical protein
MLNIQINFFFWPPPNAFLAILSDNPAQGDCHCRLKAWLGVWPGYSNSASLASGKGL